MEQGLYNEGFGLSAKKGKMIKASQGYNARLDESLGMRNKNKSQSFKAFEKMSLKVWKKLWVKELTLVHLLWR